jgi:hypothetical protein
MSISADGHGAVSYHSPTSAIYDASSGNISPKFSLLPTNKDSNLDLHLSLDHPVGMEGLGNSFWKHGHREGIPFFCVSECIVNT